MLEIGDFKIKQYQYGYELHIPYEGFSGKGRDKTKTTKHRVTYWPNLKSALSALLDREYGETDSKCRDDIQSVLDKIEESTQRVEKVAANINS